MTGVDVDHGALGAFAEAAAARGVRHQVVEGVWPDVSGQAPVTDVVVAHHVAYNAPELGGFATALSGHARHRVVLELSGRHPMGWLAPLWHRFWQLERPDGPSAGDALAVLREVGIEAHREDWLDHSRRGVTVLTPQERVAHVRSRLCLPPARDAEIARALDELDLDGPRPVVTMWWQGTASN